MNIKTLKNLITHPLISGSTIIFIGSMLANVFAYLFNLSMGRLLTVQDYGLLTSLVSIVSLFAIFQGSLSGIFTRFAARFKANDNTKAFSSLLLNGMKFTFIIAAVIFIFFAVSLIFLPSFLKVQNPLLLIIVFATIFFSIFSSIAFGVLQGEMKFYLLSFLNALGPFLKIALGVLAILVGLKIFGVIVGIFLSVFIPTLIAFVFVLKKHPFQRSNGVDETDFVKEFKNYSFYFFLATLGFTIISNTDIILVRHFFNETISGQYAALSLMGKAIFYVTSPIYFVFFPLITHKREKNESVLNTLLLAASIVVLCSVGLSFVYFLFPHFVLSIFFPAQAYAILAPYLGPYSLYILLFSLAYLFNNYFLSIGETKIYKLNLFAGAFFVLFIVLFHQSLYQVIGILFVISFLLLVSYLLYYYHLTHGKD
jgi:O-antigen/teichoic acid export membrane protein